MKKLACMWTVGTVLLFAGSAQAAATWTVSASTSDGSPLSAVTPGVQIVLDIGLTTSAPGELLGISGSISGYDPDIIRPAATGHTIASSVLNQVCFPSAGCFGGVANLESGLRVESGVEGPGEEATFLSVLSVTPAAGDGTIDQPFPQFQIVFDFIGFPPGGGNTVLNIGTFAEYADAYTGVSDSVVNNTSIAITLIPEPGTALLMGLGLAALARRRGAA